MNDVHMSIVEIGASAGGNQTFQELCRAAQHKHFDVALLDVNIAGGWSILWRR